MVDMNMFSRSDELWCTLSVPTIYNIDIWDMNRVSIYIDTNVRHGARSIPADMYLYGASVYDGLFNERSLHDCLHWLLHNTPLGLWRRRCQWQNYMTWAYGLRSTRQNIHRTR